MEIRGHIIKVERKQSRCFVDNQERESRVPNKLSSHAQASKQWRGSEFSYPESSRAAYTPPMMRSRYVHESPMGNFATTPLSSPSESTHERAATLGYRRSRPSIFPSPAGQSGSQRGHAYGTPTRAAYSSSTYGSVRASVPGRRHVRDIFNPPDEHHDERDGHAFRDQEAMISAHRRSFATPDKTNTLGAGLVDTGNTVARGSPLRSSWAHSRIDPAKIGATGKLAKAEYSPSEDGTDNEPGGALFSPGSEASTLASMPNLPDISRMFISDASAMSNMEQGHHHSPPYYDYPPMGGYNMQPIGNSLAAMGPMTGPMTPYSHQSTSSMNGSLNWMQYLPTPRPEYYGPVMWPLYPHPLPTAGEQEPGQLTPTRIAHSHSHSRMRGRDNEVQQMAGAEPSPSRGTDVGRLQARCHARRESMETQYEPKCSNDSRDGNSKK